ncbi:L10-interacting MYB domain-containing protein-like [Vicia villosa]|uniref:L10-interacting MYB domain-containing protein-like n=1 Tax=Vicia villosa TaxID=3911 RepID=UPI00273B7268|nr:L10-interacting MYB domain-containing protein-like [Vicia villosa]
MESEINTRQSNKRKRDYYDPRTLKGDELFLDRLIGVLNKDKRFEDEPFKSYIFKWTMEKMEEHLREKFPHLKPKLKAHIEWVKERLKTIYEIVYDMQNQSGFGWDDEKKMIKVDSDEVWNEYVKRNPRATDYRNTPIPLFDKLARVFGKYHASGKELAN